MGRLTNVLVVNAGSTSLKLHIVDDDETSIAVESLDTVPRASIDAVAHRVVHGGQRFTEPALIDAGVRAEIGELESLAPLHNAPALTAIDEAKRRFPNVPHVAVFDTAFHQTMPAEATTYPLPVRWRDEWGIRRYGFHGLSVAWSAQRAPQLLNQKDNDLRLAVCHLGGGCSVTAVVNGRSVDTTMGFSPLDGLPMATRSGAIDPAVLLYLLRTRGLSVAELDEALNTESGLKGLAGGTGDMRELETRAHRGESEAQLAIALFIHRLASAIAAMAVSAGGLDAIVFTAGIGEKSARIREATCARLLFFGVELDLKRNDSAQPDCDVAADGCAVRVLVLRAREEIVASRATRTLLP